MRMYTNPTQRIEGSFSWFQVVSYSGAPTFSIDDGAAITIFGFYTIPAKRRRWFKSLKFTGTLTVICGEPWDEIPPDKGCGGGLASGAKNTYRAVGAWNCIAGATQVTFGSIHHPATFVKRVEIVRWRLIYAAQATVPAGSTLISIGRYDLSAWNGAISGNTLLAVGGRHGGDQPTFESIVNSVLNAAGGGINFTGGGGTLIDLESFDWVNSQLVYSYEWKQVAPQARPLIIRANVAEGWAWRFDFPAALTGNFQGLLEIEFTEE